MKRLIIGLGIVALSIVVGGQTVGPSGGSATGIVSTCGATSGQLLFSSSGICAGTTGLTFTAAGTFLNIAQGVFSGQNGSGQAIAQWGTPSSAPEGRLASNGIFDWSNSTSSLSTIDTGLSRDASGVIDIGNGTAGDVSGTVKGRGVISASTSPATTGSCVIGSLVGGSTAGTFTATNACGAPATTVTAVVLLLPVNAPNGWSCDAQDRTAKSATALVQVASTVSAVNFQAITATNDVIQWKCIGY